MFEQNVSFIFFPKLYKICENFHIKARKLRIIVAKQTSLLVVMQISRFNSSVPADNGNVLHDSKHLFSCFNIHIRVWYCKSLKSLYMIRTCSQSFEHLHEASKIKYTIINNFPSRAYNVLHAFWIQFMNSLTNESLKDKWAFSPERKFFEIFKIRTSEAIIFKKNWYINHVLSWWYLHCMI